MKKAYIIGHNVVSPLGFSTEETVDRILEGQTGLKRDTASAEPSCTARIDDARLREAFAAIADPADFTRLEMMCLLSMSTALRSIPEPLTDIQLIVCSTKGNIDWLGAGADRPDDSVRLGVFARRLAGFFGFTQEPLVVSNACISGLQGLIIGARRIRAGRSRRVVVVGGDLVSAFALAGFRSFGALSDEFCRPFDADRKGINLGEAAATVVLADEPPTNETPRFVCESGFVTNDATHISAPSRQGEGLYQAIRRVQQSEPEPTIDFICAHGTATVYNDEMEAQAFYRSGLDQTPLLSLKGYFGHTLGASGLLETIVSLEALRRNRLIPSRGFGQEGTTRPVAVVREPEQRPMRSFLKTSSGFGGCNAALLVRQL